MLESDMENTETKQIFDATPAYYLDPSTHTHTLMSSMFIFFNLSSIASANCSFVHDHAPSNPMPNDTAPAEVESAVTAVTARGDSKERFDCRRLATFCRWMPAFCSAQVSPLLPLHLSSRSLTLEEKDEVYFLSSNMRAALCVSSTKSSIASSSPYCCNTRSSLLRRRISSGKAAMA